MTRGTKTKQTGKIMSLLTRLETGDFFYTDRPAKDVQSYASANGVKCSAKVVLVTEDFLTAPTTKRITKVVIL